MVQQALDARGLSCPLPLLKLKQRLRDMACGERIEVTTTDPGSVRDLQAFAQLTGHLIHRQTEQAGEFVFILEKRS
ncbi:MAG: hypothetical protein CML06_19095 [Pseudomonadales bacterium]|nr:hypothetical protein [Pseudomonadales bacterium]